ncbi:MAG: tyrosine-type recombinase/integrase [Pseudomonadota bacterium]
MSDLPINDVWWPVEDELTQTHPEVTGDVYELIRNDYPHLLEPAPSDPHELSSTDREALQEAVIALQRASSDPFVAFRYLAESIDRGNRREWFRILPPFVWLDIKREASPFLPASQSNNLQAARIANAVERDVQSGQRIDSVSVAAGRILLSLIAYSGVVMPRLLQGLPAVLDDAGEKIATEPWVEVPDKSGQLWRRVIIDPMTRCLVLDFHARFGALVDELGVAGAEAGSTDVVVKRCQNRRMQHRVANYLTFIELADVVGKPSVSALMKWFEARLHKQLPGFLVSYATGDYGAASLPRDNFLRLVNNRFDAEAERGTTQDSSKDAVTELFSRTSAQGASGQHEVSDSLARLYRTLSGFAELTKKAALQNLDAWFCDESVPPEPVAARLGGWAHDLLRRKRNRASREPSTVYGMLTTIGRRLEESLMGLDPVEIGEAIAYEELYNTILDQAGSRQLRRKIGVALYSFHEYLRREHNVIELEADLFDLSGSVKSQADARIITEVELNQVDARVESSTSDESLQHSFKSMLHLGFYCGMRRGEVAQLRVGDVNGHRELSVFIRPWKHQKLKTRNSIRRSPAAHLLPTETARILIGLRDAKLAAGAALDDSLWPSHATLGQRGPQDLVDAVVGMVQSTVGDTQFRFHHLRHSFATRLVLWHWYQANADSITLPDWFRSLRSEGKRATRPQLGGRNYLFAIAEVIGHGAIEVTVENYVHLMDVMLGLAMRQTVPPISRAFVETTLEVGRSRAASLIQGKTFSCLGFEAVLEAFNRTPGRPPKAVQAEQQDLDGDNPLYWQAVARQKRAGQPWPLPNMVVDWPAIRDLSSGSDASVVALKTGAPISRVQAMANFLANLTNPRVLLLSGVKAQTPGVDVPELSGDLLKGAQLWAGRFARLAMQRSTLIEAAGTFTHAWLPNTRCAVGSADKAQFQTVERLFRELAPEAALIKAHQPDPGSQWTFEQQRTYWHDKGIELSQTSRRERRVGSDSGMVVLDIDTTEWKRSQTSTLVGLRLLLVYTAMMGSQ